MAGELSSVGALMDSWCGFLLLRPVRLPGGGSFENPGAECTPPHGLVLIKHELILLTG